MHSPVLASNSYHRRQASLGCCFFSPHFRAHQLSPKHSVNVYNIGRSDVTTDRLRRPVRHQRRWSHQTQARRAPSIWRQLVTSRNRVASTSRVHIHFLYPLQKSTTRLTDIDHRAAYFIYREHQGYFILKVTK
jgi:hypothetical protein